MKRWDVFLSGAFCIGVLLLTAGSLAGDAPDVDKPTWIGAQTCAGCHQDMAKEWERQSHARYLMAPGRKAEGKGCEECHGPGSKHAAGDTSAIVNPRKLKPDKDADLCLQCHRQTIKTAEWHASPHAKNRLACSQCHDTHHAPKGPKLLRAPAPDLCFGCHPQQRGQFRQNSHHPVLEGRMSCMDCHDPHRSSSGTTGAQHPDELCSNCHTDKTGPFLYAHDLAAGDPAEGCLACHRSHGSPHPQLQRIGGRGLCQQCHLDKVSHNPGPTCWTTGCHSQIHGSNQSPNFLR